MRMQHLSILKSLDLTHSLFAMSPPPHNLFIAHFIFIAFFTSLRRIGHSDFSPGPALFTLMHFSGVKGSVARRPSMQTDDFNAC